MKPRSIIRWTLLLTLVLPLLAVGCGATSEPGPAEPTAGIEVPTKVFEPTELPVETEVPAPTEQPAETEVSEEPSGEVTFITHAGEQFELIALTQAVNEFMDRYPKVKMTCTIVVPVEGWDQGLSTPCQIVVAQ